MGQIRSAGAMDIFPECLDTLCGSRKYPSGLETNFFDD